MSLGRILAAAVFASAAIAASAASAGTLTVTYTCTATDIIDPTGLLGLSPGVTSAAFVDTYVYDLSKGGRVTCCGFDEVYGGSNFGLSSPLVDSTLTINGTKVDFPGGSGDQAFYQQGAYAESYSDLLNPGPGGWLFNFVHMYANAPAGFETAFSDSGTGYGNFFICDPAFCNVDTYELAGDFSPTGIKTTFSSGAPEPASWGLMIVGFGGLGGALRRRQRLPRREAA